MRSGEDWTAETAAKAERAIGYTFEDKELLKRCFTHSSYANGNNEASNERLEFLGDAVLGLCVSENLFLNFRSFDEGELTDVRQEYVSQTALTQSEKQADLMRFLRFSGGEENVRGKTASSLFEAVAAGIYLDGGLKAASEFILTFAVRVEDKNYRSLLQELVQSKIRQGGGKAVLYTGREENGEYVCTASALGVSATGRAKFKKAAEKAAAEALYQLLARESN